MAIGIVTDDELQKELENLNPIKKPTEAKVEIIEENNHGRNQGDNNVPDSLRKLIGETSVIDGRPDALALARMFGVSDSSVSAYAAGATSTSSIGTPKPSLVNHLTKSRARATKRASYVMREALKAITPGKLEETGAKDLSSIAKDMSAIIKNLEPQTPQDDGKVKQPQFVVFAPQFRQENSFEMMVLDE